MLFISIVLPVIVSIFTWAIFHSGYKTGWCKGYMTRYEFEKGLDQGRYDGYPVDGNESNEFCEKCHQLFFAHNDDGSCVED